MSRIHVEHRYGSPWWYFQSGDGGVHFGICEHRAGRFRIYVAESRDDLAMGNGMLESEVRSLKAAMEHVGDRINALDPRKGE